MYQRILVPVDGSETSDSALHEAIRFAQQHNATLRLVHVIEDARFFESESMIDYSTLQDMARRSGEQVLSRAATAVQQAGLTAETDLLELDGRRVENLIVAEAKRWPADLIVIGTHGRSGVSRLLFGSVAEGVVRGAHIPILLIRGE
ncbi:MAG: universal stress protein [Sideroxydans sp.]|nr:universal stress protein [Sideroxydans sp.]